MAAIAFLVAVSSIGFFAAMVFLFALDLLPFAVAIAVGAFAHRHGLGPFAAIALGLVCLLVLMVISGLLVDLTRSPPLRRAMALLFAAVAAAAGYSAEYGIALQCAFPADWAQGMALVSAAVLGLTAGWRVIALRPDPDDAIDPVEDMA